MVSRRPRRAGASWTCNPRNWVVMRGPSDRGIRGPPAPTTRTEIGPRRPATPRAPQDPDRGSGDAPPRQGRPTSRPKGTTGLALLRFVPAAGAHRFRQSADGQLQPFWGPVGSAIVVAIDGPPTAPNSVGGSALTSGGPGSAARPRKSSRRRAVAAAGGDVDDTIPRPWSRVREQACRRGVTERVGATSGLQPRRRRRAVRGHGRLPRPVGHG